MFRERSGTAAGESSTQIWKQVIVARQIQIDRFKLRAQITRNAREGRNYSDKIELTPSRPADQAARFRGLMPGVNHRSMPPCREIITKLYQAVTGTCGEAFLRMKIKGRRLSWKL